MADRRPRILAEVQAALSWFRPDTVSSAWTRSKRHMTRTGERRSAAGSSQEEWRA
jgi:spore germination cell wall hydrolase CwlJ-like protein